MDEDFMDRCTKNVYFKQREIKHYQIDYNDYRNNYNLARNTVIEIMNDVINDHKKIYFHCRIGTDRTGTIAYILEGLLGVNQEEMLEDYEKLAATNLVQKRKDSSNHKRQQYSHAADQRKALNRAHDAEKSHLAKHHRDH